MATIYLDPFRGGNACVRNGALLLDCPCLGCLDVRLGFQYYYNSTPGTNPSSIIYHWGLPTLSFTSTELTTSTFSISGKNTSIGPLGGPCDYLSMAGTIEDFKKPSGLPPDAANWAYTFAHFSDRLDSDGAIDCAGTGLFQVLGRTMEVDWESSSALRGGDATSIYAVTAEIKSDSAPCQVTVTLERQLGTSWAYATGSFVLSGRNISGQHSWTNAFHVDLINNTFSSSDMWTGVRYHVGIVRL